MITGAHAIIYSKNSDADRAFLKDVLGLGHVDVGGGWLIFGLPPSEVAVHPGDKDSVHELYLMCDDIELFCATLEAKRIQSSPVKDQGWGLLTTVTLPGGGELGVYEPRHARPSQEAKGSAKRAAKPKQATPAKKVTLPKKAAPAKKSAPAKKAARAKKAAPAKAKAKKTAKKPASARS